MDLLKKQKPAVRIFRLVMNSRLPLTNEKEAQSALFDLLEKEFGAGKVSREHRLSKGNVVDLFVPECGLAIEMKMNSASKAAIFRQLERYCKHDEVKSVILLANKAMGLPAEICGKPAYVMSMGRSWL